MVVDHGDHWRPTAALDALRLRARVHACIRAFMDVRGVLEVETPVLSIAGNTDPNIASFQLEFSGRTDGAPRTRWLRTSPEFALKRLLSAGVGELEDPVASELRHLLLERHPREQVLDPVGDRTRSVAALIGLVRAGARPSLGVGVDREDAVPDREAARDRQVQQRARRFLRDNLEMQGLPADHTAKRDRTFIGRAGALGGIDRDCDGGRYLECARHAHALRGHAGFFQRALTRVDVHARPRDQV